jgi:hypothetical protein
MKQLWLLILLVFTSFSVRAAYAVISADTAVMQTRSDTIPSVNLQEIEIISRKNRKTWRKKRTITTLPKTPK